MYICFSLLKDITYYRDELKQINTTLEESPTDSEAHLIAEKQLRETTRTIASVHASIVDMAKALIAAMTEFEDSCNGDVILLKESEIYQHAIDVYISLRDNGFSELDYELFTDNSVKSN